MMRATQSAAIAGGLVVGAVSLAVCLFLLWCSAATSLAAHVGGGPASEPNIVAETMLLLSGVETVAHMNVANYACFAVMVVLVVVLSRVEGALVSVEQAIEKKAKLPSVELVRHINDNYDTALRLGGVAHKEKRMRKR
ncbi:hypothetical protein DQ04_00861070 [Trypanosoma grayi]|uniref:hypothetical protein n=1 Tax=Trypanosoma grayi TaxID=71804 RepID=UPI0004F48A2B|nr:hypothetical protein DQ04_00861070 [Trypanosoma grayi]KEG13665.1 hypothetical protein DQ04_00861070 [Trypanosoma grayi]